MVVLVRQQSEWSTRCDNHEANSASMSNECGEEGMQAAETSEGEDVVKFGEAVCLQGWGCSGNLNGGPTRAPQCDLTLRFASSSWWVLIRGK
jgi:hypothetical protein